MTIPHRSRRARRAWAIGLTGVLAAGVTAAVAQAPAEAAACTSPVKYAPSSNTVYLLTADKPWTLGDIKAACPAAPLEEVDVAHKVWELRADLVLNNGATLQLHGSTAGGDVDVLRLRSLASNAATEVQAITAHWGTIDVDGVDITSWDDAANGPDTDPKVPAGATGVRGRAYIRAQSYLDNGTPRLSRMTFANSTVENLGWYAAGVLRHLVEVRRVPARHRPGDRQQPGRLRVGPRQRWCDEHQVPRELHGHLRLGRPCA